MGHKRKGENGEEEDSPRRPSAKNLLLDLIHAKKWMYWHDGAGRAFVTMKAVWGDGESDDTSGDHIERHPIKSRALSIKLRQLFASVHRTEGGAPGSIGDGGIKEVTDTFEALAMKSPAREPRMRTLKDADGSVWIDRGDETWAAIHVTTSGWRIVEAVHVPLIREGGMKSLPEPRTDPDALNKMRALANLGSEEDTATFVLWLLSALWPQGPHPILAIGGEGGSGKSFLSRIARRLTDPHAVPFSPLPGKVEEVLLAGSKSWVLAFDNLSSMTPEIADALAGRATGTSFQKKQLYTDGELYHGDVRGPILLNGIPDLAARRADLASRTLTLSLPRISDSQRRTEAEMEDAFEAAAPGVLALLLDAMVVAMKRLPSLKLAASGRMADFYHLAVAAAPGFGWSEDWALGVLTSNRANMVADVIDSDVVAAALLALHAESGNFRGSPAELLHQLNLAQTVSSEGRESREWPRTPAQLATRIKRSGGALQDYGLAIETHRSNGRRVVTIARPEVTL